MSESSINKADFKNETGFHVGQWVWSQKYNKPVLIIAISKDGIDTMTIDGQGNLIINYFQCERDLYTIQIEYLPY